jgi:hypothetical protein
MTIHILKFGSEAILRNNLNQNQELNFEQKIAQELLSDNQKTKNTSLLALGR